MIVFKNYPDEILLLLSTYSDPPPPRRTSGTLLALWGRRIRIKEYGRRVDLMAATTATMVTIHSTRQSM